MTDERVKTKVTIPVPLEEQYPRDVQLLCAIQTLLTCFDDLSPVRKQKVLKFFNYRAN